MVGIKALHVHIDVFFSYIFIPKGLHNGRLCTMVWCTPRMRVELLAMSFIHRGWRLAFLSCNFKMIKLPTTIELLLMSLMSELI